MPGPNALIISRRRRAVAGLIKKLCGEGEIGHYSDFIYLGLVLHSLDRGQP